MSALEESLPLSSASLTGTHPEQQQISLLEQRQLMSTESQRLEQSLNNELALVRQAELSVRSLSQSNESPHCHILRTLLGTLQTWVDNQSDRALFVEVISLISSSVVQQHTLLADNILRNEALSNELHLLQQKTTQISETDQAMQHTLREAQLEQQTILQSMTDQAQRLHEYEKTLQEREKLLATTSATQSNSSGGSIGIQTEPLPVTIALSVSTYTDFVEVDLKPRLLERENEIDRLKSQLESLQEECARGELQVRNSSWNSK